MRATIVLSAYGYEAEICPARGANLIRLDHPHSGIQALNTPVSLECFQKENPMLFGAPLLFPPNRISDARFSFDGREYTFPINEPKLNNFLHGTLHQTPFELLAADKVSVLCRYRATEKEPYLSFPHAFTLEISHTLNPDGMYQRVSVINDSQQNMPVALGFHTTFRIPFARGGRPEDVRLRLSAGREYQRDAHTYLPTGVILEDYALYNDLNGDGIAPIEQALSCHCEMTGAHCMELWDADTGASIVYHPGDGYRFWMLYNGGRKDIVCVEPQTWLANCPNAPFPREETGFTWLAPNEKRTYDAFVHFVIPS